MNEDVDMRTYRLNTVLTMLLLLLAAHTVFAQQPPFQAAEGGVRYQVLQEGTGPVAEPGDIATIHYVGWIDDAGTQGREFFNSRRAGEPVRFVVGTDKVMPAWNAAVVGMHAGGRRLVLVPAAMGYGERGVQGIVPANASLRLQIELLALEKSAAP